MAKNQVGELFQKRIAADQVYRLTCEIRNLHATQGRNEGKTLLSHDAIKETTDTTHTEGVPSGESSTPSARRRGRHAVKEKEVQTYRFERNEKPGTVLLALGGPYGFFSKTLRDAVVAKERAKYWLPSLALIAFAPDGNGGGDYVEVKAATTIDARDDTPKPYTYADGRAYQATTELPRMEPRNSGRGGVRSMVPVFHERIPGAIKVTMLMRVNSECPRTDEEIAGLLHAMQGMPTGAAKRGLLKIVKIERVQ